jgi:predicted HicB family RNase H-like nuclease
MKRKPRKEKKPMLKPMLVRVPENLLRRAKHAAIDRGTKLQTLVADALAAYLSEKEGK